MSGNMVMKFGVHVTVHHDKFLIINQLKRLSLPITGLMWSRGFQEVKVPRFLDNGTGRW